MTTKDEARRSVGHQAVRAEDLELVFISDEAHLGSDVALERGLAVKVVRRVGFHLEFHGDRAARGKALGLVPVDVEITPGNLARDT